ncbi:MAG: hypothetical protein CUN56_11400 [Phototrophicales bacterium]|nr:MAG: hypothetical protein CUN56_11400 [Phototrophicales bacterium]RMG73759.1 MAG: methyltransferase domain-containing protein [Chloroflexota bacterium]
MMPAFDSLAQSYDETFTYRQLGIWLRELVRSHIPFQPGDSILEIGCGTGEDALWMASQQLNVTATDASPAMLAQAQAKAADTPIQWEILDINTLDNSLLMYQFDGVFSNFGAINCAENRPLLAQWLSQRVRLGGKLIFVVMNTICPWEIAYYLLKLKPAQAFRRFKNGLTVYLDQTSTIRVWYPSPCRIIQDFRPYFKHRRTVGIGTLLPPTYLDAQVSRYPKLFAYFKQFDQRFGAVFPLTWLNDHYLIEFERCGHVS